jgi:hypothetical protein
MRENVIRSIELGIALIASYMVSITLVQTTLFGVLIEKISERFAGTEIIPYLQYIDLIIISLAVILNVYMWSKESEVWFGRLFSFNMLMFFPAVLDFSTFNWISLILDYTPNPGVTALWVFAVGLVLQITYLLLRYTVRFRYLRKNLEVRGALQEDIDQVTGGQMNYLAALSILTAGLTTGIYLIIPYLNSYMAVISNILPNNHIVIGIIVVFWISAALILYLRVSSR